MHSCNDAPCQLNFTSMEGIDRGASVETVYNGARFSQQDPSRLGIDAHSTQQWRDRGFFPVLNERRQKWEVFLNASSNKEKLMSRYLYEHLFLGHLYFKDVSSTDFFTLVRSKTPSGQPIDMISTIRPYNDPGVADFYCRLKHYNRVIVDKIHLPYALNKKRMTRYKELFLTPDYTVEMLPSYEPELAANPFKTFSVIPSKSRYKFLLDEAQFFVGGFIKGAVCRGSIALSVIDDHFWVAFMDPDKSLISQD